VGHPINNPTAEALAPAEVLALEGRVDELPDPEREEMRVALEEARAERDRLRGSR
jgi:hypothetical protein